MEKKGLKEAVLFQEFLKSEIGTVAELGGQLGIDNFIESVDIPRGWYSLKTACDGIIALNKVGMKAEYIKISSKYTDMVSMIIELWFRSSFIPLPTHVYRHQDNTNIQMSRLEKLNCKVGLLAKYIATKHISEKTTYSIIPSSLGIGTVTCYGELVTSRIQHTLYNTILYEQLITLYTKHFNIPHDVLKTEVSWKKIQSARKECRWVLIIFMTKWLSGNTTVI